VSALQQFREWLLRIPFSAVVGAGFGLCLLFPICAQPLGEAGLLLELPFGAIWLLTCALVTAHVHRATAMSHSAVLQFGAPIAIAALYAGLSMFAGGSIGFWIASHVLLHQK
jgi:hypothetical protein